MIAGLRLSSTSLDENDISILNNIILALGHDLASCLNSGFITVLSQHTIVEDETLDESLF